MIGWTRYFPFELGKREQKARKDQRKIAGATLGGWDVGIYEVSPRRWCRSSKTVLILIYSLHSTMRGFFFDFKRLEVLIIKSRYPPLPNAFSWMWSRGVGIRTGSIGVWGGGEAEEWISYIYIDISYRTELGYRQKKIKIIILHVKEGYHQKAKKTSGGGAGGNRGWWRNSWDIGGGKRRARSWSFGSGAETHWWHTLPPPFRTPRFNINHGFLLK